MQGLDFSVVSPYLDVIWTGMMWTAIITVCASDRECDRWHRPCGRGSVWAGCSHYPVRLFSWVFMGTPLLLQLYLIYFGLVQIGIDIPALIAGIIGLGLHFAVYNADILRAGILAVDVGQTEGARTIGFSPLANAPVCRRSTGHSQHRSADWQQSYRTSEGILASSPSLEWPSSCMRRNSPSAKPIARSSSTFWLPPCITC